MDATACFRNSLLSGYDSHSFGVWYSVCLAVESRFVQLLTCELSVRSIRRRYSRGLPRKYNTLLKKLGKAKKEAPLHDKPETVKTHLRNMIIVPEMIGSVVGVYNGKTYVGVEVKVCFAPFLCVLMRLRGPGGRVGCV